MSELSRLVDALLGAWSSSILGRGRVPIPRCWPNDSRTASKACDTASARAAVRASECGKVLERPDVFLARVTDRQRSRRVPRWTRWRRCTTFRRRSRLVRGEVSLAQAAAIASAPGHRARTAGARSIEELGSCEGCGAQASARGDRTRTAARPSSRRAVLAAWKTDLATSLPGRIAARSRGAVRRHARSRD